MSHVEKTIGPAASKVYHLEPAVSVAPNISRPPITQAILADVAARREALERGESELRAIELEIVGQLRAGAFVEAGALAAAPKANMKRRVVAWRAALIDLCGEKEALALEAAAKAGPAEVSSYSLELRRTDGSAEATPQGLPW